MSQSCHSPGIQLLSLSFDSLRTKFSIWYCPSPTLFWLLFGEYLKEVSYLPKALKNASEWSHLCSQALYILSKKEKRKKKSLNKPSRLSIPPNWKNVLCLSYNCWVTNHPKLSGIKHKATNYTQLCVLKQPFILLIDSELRIWTKCNQDGLPLLHNV